MLVDYALLALLDTSPIHPDRGRVLQPELGPILNVIIDFGVKEKRLGGNTTHVQASTPQVWISFNQGRRKPELAGTYGRRVPGRPASDDGQIVDSVNHRGLRSNASYKRPAQIDDCNRGKKLPAAGREQLSLFAALLRISR
jgi:hypothetical protein